LPKSSGILANLFRASAFIVTNMSRPAERVVAFYNKRGTCEQWIKEGKGAIIPCCGPSQLPQGRHCA
jgi:hypothetical protein